MRSIRDRSGSRCSWGRVLFRRVLQIVAVVRDRAGTVEKLTFESESCDCGLDSLDPDPRPGTIYDHRDIRRADPEPPRDMSDPPALGPDLFAELSNKRIVSFGQSNRICHPGSHVASVTDHFDTKVSFAIMTNVSIRKETGVINSGLCLGWGGPATPAVLRLISIGC